MVGQKVRGMAGILGRAFAALGRENVNIVASTHGASECNISFVVARKDVDTALIAAHQEFQLGALTSPVASCYYGSQRATAEAD